MQSNIAKSIEKIFTALGKLDKFPRSILKYGTQAFLLLFAVGTFMVLYNHTMQKFDPYFEFVATSLVKNSFIVFAEVVIGSLIIDYVFKK